MRSWLAAAAVGALIGAGCAANLNSRTAGASGAQLLQRAEVATLHTDYQGYMESRTLWQGGWHVTEVRGYYARPGLSRLDYQTPPMSGVTDVQGQGYSWHYDPRTHKLVVTHGSVPSRWEWMRQNYRVVVGPHRQMAGRDVIQVDVVPKHPGNPWERLWVDADTKVILGHEHYRSDGKLASASWFKQVQFKAVPETLFAPPAVPIVASAPMKLARPMKLVDLQRLVGFPLAMPRTLPPGYRPEGYFLTRCEDGCGAPVALTRFSNGLNTITYFQSRHVMDPTGSCTVRSHGGTQDVRLVRNNTDYVLIGDLDPDQLRSMAMSIPRITP